MFLNEEIEKRSAASLHLFRRDFSHHPKDSPEEVFRILTGIGDVEGESLDVIKRCGKIERQEFCFGFHFIADRGMVA